MTRGPGRPPLAPVVSLLVSAMGLVALGRLGRGELAAPDGFAPAELSAWMSERDPAAIAFSMLRLGAMAAGGYVLVLAALQVACSLGRWRSLASMVERVTIPALRGVVTGAVTISVSASAFGAPASASPPPAGEEEGVTMRVLHDPPPSTEPAAATTSVPETASVGPISPPAPSGPATAGPGLHVASEPGEEDIWTVEPGDSFWTIAASHLAEVRGEPGSDAEIARYWRSLVDANSDILVVPGNVDLLFAGQVVTLVPVI